MYTLGDMTKELEKERQELFIKNEALKETTEYLNRVIHAYGAGMELVKGIREYERSHGVKNAKPASQELEEYFQDGPSSTDIIGLD
jgi:hypothetical protein